MGISRRVHFRSLTVERYAGLIYSSAWEGTNGIIIYHGHTWRDLHPQPERCGDTTASTARLKPLGIPVIGAEKDLYSIITGEQLSHMIETQWFKPLDGRYGPVLRDIKNGTEISPTCLTDLANFVAYLSVRTPAKIREIETNIHEFDSLLGPERDAIKYYAHPADRGPDTYVVSDEHSAQVSSHRADAVRRNQVLNLIVKLGMQLAQALLYLRWTMLVAPSGRNFIIGDNPYVIVPPEAHDLDAEGVGPITPGATLFVPLSSDFLFENNEPGRCDGCDEANSRS